MDDFSPDPSLDAFLTAYGDALTRFDARASAALWGVPATILTDEFAGALHSRDELAAGLEQSYPLYRMLGLSRVGHTLLERTDLTPSILRIRVRWHFFGEGDEPLTDSDYEYTLRRDDDGLHAYVAVGIDEAQKIAELARRKGIDLAAPGTAEA